MPDLPDVSEGQRPSADWTNALKEIACHEHTGAIGYSDDEQTVIPIFSDDPLDLYELTGAPVLDDTAREYKATAKPCIRRVSAIDGDGHVTGVGTLGSDPTRWIISPTALDETIWFPAGNRDTNGEPLAAPTVTTGDRVWTTDVYSERVVVAVPRSGGIPFRNDSGEEAPAFALMAVTGIGTDDNDNWFLKIDKPDTTFRRAYMVNGSGAIADSGATGGSQGRCYDGSDGPVKVLYDTGTPAIAEGFGAKPGQWTASKNYPCCLDVFGDYDNTDKIMVARLHPILKIIGKLAGALSEGSSATVNVWNGAGGSEAVISSLTLTGYDWLLASGADDIASGKKVVVEWINGVPYITAAECA